MRGRTESPAAPDRRNRGGEPERVRQIADEIVRAARVGRDAEGRDVLMLEVDLPGRGDLRVRLRRDGSGFETRFRTDDHRLARDLRENDDKLRESAARRGVELTDIEVAERND